MDFGHAYDMMMGRIYRRRCRKYFIKGPKKGSIENFADDLPGFPDNIRYDGEGQYWIGLSSVSNH